jgi:hypothetical protein
MKRRALPGHTHDPYECCGKEAGNYGRPKGRICDACGELITEGKRAREALQGQGLQVYRWVSRDYAWPAYYSVPGRFSGGASGSSAHDVLRTAVFDLVQRVSTPAPAGTPHQAPTFIVQKRWDGRKERIYDDWPLVIPVKGDWHDWRCLVLMAPAVRDAIVQLDAAIRVALEDRYETGKDHGSSLLFALAHGEKTIADYEEQRKPEREQQK